MVTADGASVAGSPRGREWRMAACVAIATFLWWLATCRPWLYHFYGDTWHQLDKFTTMGIRQIWFPHNEHYTPLALLGWYYQFRLFGVWALGFHLVTIGLHALNAGLLYRVSGMFTGNLTARLLGTGFFAASGVLFEVVFWDAVQQITLGLAGLLLAMLAAARYASQPHWRWLAAAGGATVMSVLSSTYGILTPLFLAVFTFPLAGQQRVRRTIAVTVAAVAAVAACGALIALAGKGPALGATWGQASQGVGVSLLAEWLRSGVWKGAIEASMAPLGGPPWLALAALLAAIGVARRSLSGSVGLTVVAFCLMVVPHLLTGLGRAGKLEPHAAAASRYEYLPIAGFGLLIAWACGAAFQWCEMNDARALVVRIAVMISLALHAAHGVIVTDANSPWPYWGREAEHFFRETVLARPGAVPEGMMSVAPVMEVSHFLTPWPMNMDALYRIFQFSGYPVLAEGLSLRQYVTHPDVRRANLLNSRQFGNPASGWKLSGAISGRQRPDAIFEIRVPARSKGQMDLLVERIAEQKPTYSLIVGGRLAAGQPDAQFRLAFYGRDGQQREVQSAGTLGTSEQAPLLAGVVATTQSTELRLEIFVQAGEQDALIELRELSVLRHPVLVPVSAVPENVP